MDSDGVTPSQPDDPVPPRLDRPYEFEVCWSEGWSLLKSQYGVLLGAVAITIGIALSINIVTRVLNASTHPAGTIVGMALNCLIAYPYSAGVLLFAARLARGESPSIGATFDGFHRYTEILLVQFQLLVSLSPASRSPRQRSLASRSMAAAGFWDRSC